MSIIQCASNSLCFSMLGFSFLSLLDVTVFSFLGGIEQRIFQVNTLYIVQSGTCLLLLSSINASANCSAGHSFGI